MIKAALDAFNEWIDCDTAGIKVCFHAETIRHCLEHYEKMKWQPIKTAPRDGTKIIINRSNTMWHNFAEASWKQGPCYKMGWVAYDNEGTYIANPTHWMPLPSSPEDKP